MDALPSSQRPLTALPVYRQRWIAALQALAMSLMACVALSLAAPYTWAATPPVDAAIEPSEITLGESARLTVTMAGGGDLSVNLPVVPGLELRVVGHSHQYQMINGITLENSSTIIRVTPETAGTFKIPGLSSNSAPLVLRVNPSGSGGAIQNPDAAPGLLPPTGGTGANGIRLTPDGSAFVRVEIPKRDVYVGESVPVEIQVGMRDGFVASINGIPKLNSNDFTLNNLSHQPERGGRVLDGKQFTVLTWRSVLAAVKPGKFGVTFETPLTVRIRTRPRNDSLVDDMLGDPFMQNFFGPTVARNITVTSPEAAFTVLPLPDQGRPADFSGAVGDFKITTDISSVTNTAGDPLTLRMHVTGSGNFDRVESSMLFSGDPWKTYDAKSTFKPEDPIGFRGEKTFEQPVVASKPGNLTIPALAFNYFDPETRRYEAAHSAPLHVTVAPSAAQTAANGAAPANPTRSPTAADPSGLLPDHALSGYRTPSLTPPYYRPGLVAIPAVLAGLFVAAWLILRRHERISGDLERAREQAHAKLLQELTEQMSAAAAAGNAAAYFKSARAALQQALGARWGSAPADIGPAEIGARLADDPDRESVQRIFALADETNYSGDDVEARDFDRWTPVVVRQLRPEGPS